MSMPFWWTWSCGVVCSQLTILLFLYFFLYSRICCVHVSNRLREIFAVLLVHERDAMDRSHTHTHTTHSHSHRGDWWVLSWVCEATCDEDDEAARLHVCNAHSASALHMNAFRSIRLSHVMQSHSREEEPRALSNSNFRLISKPEPNPKLYPVISAHYILATCLRSRTSIVLYNEKLCTVCECWINGDWKTSSSQRSSQQSNLHNLRVRMRGKRNLF